MKQLLIAGVVFFVLTRFRGAVTLNYNIVGIKWNNNKPVLVLAVYNGASVSASFKSIIADVMINGSRIGVANVLQEVVIPPGSKTTVNIPVDIDGTGLGYLASQIYQQRQNFIKKVNLSLSGQINIGGVQLPLNLNYELV